MKLSLRFVLPLVLILGLIAYFLLPLVDYFTSRWFVRDLETRSRIVSSLISDPVATFVAQKRLKGAETFLSQSIQDARLLAVGYCSESLNYVLKTSLMPPEIKCIRLNLNETFRSETLRLETGAIHIVYTSIPSQPGASLVIANDLRVLETRSAETKRYLFYLFALIAIVISALTVVIAQLSWRGWNRSVQRLIDSLTKGKVLPTEYQEFTPLVKDLRTLVKELKTDRATTEFSRTAWTAKTLKEVLLKYLYGDKVLIVSNREPYIHVKKNHKIEAQFPASGLVSALEPIMRACSGTWIAHGSGNADRDVVDHRDHVRVPPDDPQYDIRRVWLTEKEEEGYYYGFSNEGLWPLCHIAHSRPIFRLEDWHQYVAVNQKFAEAVFQEVSTPDPVILVQDYHFALLPQIIRSRLPDATIISFWHIPWPNPEAFGICPWREQILEGLLGSSILGFHTQFHCNNFIETVDRYLESRIDKENSSISYKGHLTAIRPYPISIEWPPRWLKDQKPPELCRSIIFERLGLAPTAKLGVGVDRLDYTKGITERFLAVERLLELHPEFIGQFTFLQIAAPSRTRIERYKQLDVEVKEVADRINARFQKDNYRPIILKIEHHEPHQVFEYFRAADVCMVTSLHDGMNLVAKEFVSAREDHKGVLILSLFAGASRELPEALVVNPYNIEQCAQALFHALTMPVKEQVERMKSMRQLIAEYNVYRWAGRMLTDAAKVRERHRFLQKTRSSFGFERWSWYPKT